MPVRPPVTVVVCSHDRPDLLRDALAHIEKVAADDDPILVVTSGTSGSATTLATSPQPLASRALVVVESPSRAKTAKLNLAIRAATTELVVTTDDDCRVEQGWVDGLANALADDTSAGAAFGPVVGLTAGGRQPAATLPPGPAPMQSWAYAHGASMGLRRRAVIDAGGFDERLGPGALVPAGEEGDLVARLVERGWRPVIAAAPPVVHTAWRSDAEDRANLLVYERGAGAWLGAALRRDPRRAGKLLVLRVAHLLALARTTPAGWGFRARMGAAFLMGLVRGLAFAPHRFLDEAA